MKEFDKRQSLLEAREEIFQNENMREAIISGDVSGDKDESFENKDKKRKTIIIKTKEFLFKGWKKDLKKINNFLTIIFYLVAIFAVISIFSGSVLGWKTNIFFSKVNYKTYNHIGPDLSFKYPNYFVIDSGAGKNYGQNYLAGLKLSTDPRTGCDLRLSSSGINFSKSDAEIKAALVSEISKTAKDFNLISAKRTSVDGENAFSLVFTFTDPISSKVRLDQIITGHGKNYYMIICGTGDYQYKFFESDFDSFIDSFKWKSSLES